MRDPGRIPLLLSTIERVWKRSPDLRLGQLLVHAIESGMCGPIFYMEDDKLLESLLKIEPTLRHVEPKK